MINPVLKKEMKTKMRTWRTIITISLYALALSSLMILIYSQTFVSYRNINGFKAESLKIMYVAVIIFQFAMIIFIVPTLTSGSISGEKERRTFDLLICSKLSSFSIILGKLLAALSQIILLLIISIPVLGVLFLFGGISPLNVISIFLFNVVIAILIGSIGIFNSAIFKKTTTATVISYLVTFFLAGGTFIIVGMLKGLFFVYNKTFIRDIISQTVMYINPFSGLAAIISHQIGGDFIGELVGTNAGWTVLTPLYINIAFDLIVSVILLYLASIKINPMKRSKKLKKG